MASIYNHAATYKPGRYHPVLGCLTCLIVAGGCEFAPTKKPTMIYLYDLTHTLSANLSDRRQAARVWDEIHAVATLQGIVNRDEPRLYLRYVTHGGLNVDDWWLEKLSRPGEWLEGAAREQVDSLEALVERFRKRIAGAVVYDPRVPATSNLASTLAGVEDLVAIRFDETPGSVYDRLVAKGPRLPVVRRLIADDGSPMFTGRRHLPGGHAPSSGSAKCDAYLWALHEVIETGRCNPAYLGYYIDSYWIDRATATKPSHHTLANHDYFVARRAFFCDLHCWGDETPVDDPGQPLGTDLTTFKAILHALYKRNRGDMIHIGGFTPWAFKYTSFGDAGGRHGPVDTEWELVRLVSAYNGFLDADAIGLGAIANASFYMHYPLKRRYAQAPRPTTETLRRRGYLDKSGGVRTEGRCYVMFYVGDYDSAAWLYKSVPTLWEDGARGTVPLSWAVSPVLERRAPMALEYMWRTRSENDAFIAADNGAGYLNPSMLSEPRPISGLPSGVAAWVAHCRPFYRRWDLTITGFIIDGHAPAMPPAVLDAYAAFSPDGIAPQKVSADTFMHSTMPVLRAGPDITESDPKHAAERIAQHIASRPQPGPPFHWFRTILKSPSWHAKVAAELSRLDPSVEVVSAPVFFELLRRHLADPRPGC
jgi:hypothetical protein